MSKLLAPNGKPSNLTAEQYKLVRTPAFKKWFGDWEKDPENASKVVDENGEPLVCYHQSDSEKIDVFKPKSNKNKVNDFFFFSTTEQSFLQRKHTYKFFLSPKKTFSTHSEELITKNEYGKDIGLNRIKRISDKELNELSSIIYKNQNIIIEEWKKKNTDSIEDVIDYLKSENKPSDNLSAIIDFIKNWNDSWSVLEQDLIINYIIENGYDSFITKEEGITNIALNNPNQIKLADGTNTTFDGNNPDIRFDEGGEIELKLDEEYKKLMNDENNFPFNILNEKSEIIGRIELIYREDLGGYQIYSSKVKEKGKGIGKKAYIKLRQILGKPIISDSSRTEDAENLWKSLERNNLSFFDEKIDKYKMYKTGGSISNTNIIAQVWEWFGIRF